MLAQTRGYPGPGTVFVTDTGLRLTLRGRTADHHWLMEPAKPGPPTELLGRLRAHPAAAVHPQGPGRGRGPRSATRPCTPSTWGRSPRPPPGLHFTPELLDRLDGEAGSAPRG